MVTPQSIARGWIHDAMCMSDSCPLGDCDHARRTQSTFGRDAVRAWKAGDSLASVIHDRACPCLGRVEAADRPRHVAAFEKAAAELTALLGQKRASRSTTLPDEAAS